MSACLVLDLSIIDFEPFREYIEKIPSFIQKYGGKYLVEGEVPTVIEGDWEPERLVVIQFPSREHANAFLNDPEVKTLFAIRHKSTISKLVLVDGNKLL